MKAISNKDKKDFQRSLIKWYRQFHRKLPWRESKNPYFIWVSEVMLQQTQVNTVLNYFPSFIKKFPNIHTLADAKLEEVLKSWELMGYYARARNLHRAVQLVVEKYQGKVPRSYEEFKKLPGVGEYIAAAVTSIAFGLPYPVIDGNVKRVVARLFEIDIPINTKQFLVECKGRLSSIFNQKRPGEFNQALMELGATLCTPKNPTCPACPVRAYCGAYKNHMQLGLPVKIAKKKVLEHQIALGVILDNHKLLITQRKPNGLLGGLWELPGGKVRPGETAQEACTREIKEEVNLDVNVKEFLTRIRHAYTHFKIVVDVFLCEFRSGEIRLKGPVDYRWVTSSEMNQYPFPAANHKIFYFLTSKLAYFKNYKTNQISLREF